MIGQTISHYRIVSPLGSGGMGVVYEAEDLRLGRRVALKFLPREAGADAVTLERFLREARIVSSLNHPHICTLHDIGEHEGQQFMVMELLEGEPLKARLARGPLPLDELLDLGAQLADALDAAHAQGVVHRDLKPANLFITRRGQLKVLDFGVAKLGESRRGDLAETRAATELTTAGSTVGTVAYMSPEQSRGQEIDARSDLFSLGIVLYEMAVGRSPFQGPTPAVIFEGILTRVPVPPSEVNATIPGDFDRIVGKALEKDREMRYQSAADVRADLKRLRRETDSGVTAAVTGTLPAAGATSGGTRASTRAAVAAASATASRRRAWLVGAPVVSLAVAAGLFVWLSERAPALTTRDTVVLADFVNRTGDTDFDDTLAEALAVQLRQSPFLNLASEQQVQSTLRLMGRSPEDQVTPELGRDLCQRVGGKAVLGGSIASLGGAYLLTLSAQDCVTGEVLAEAQDQADSKEGVLRALGRIASDFRERLGESLASIERYDAPIEEATTRSLEALKAYTQGVRARLTQGDFESVAFFRRAIELDPEFALAYARLGTVYSNLGQPDDSKKMTGRAWELRERVSERERLYIEARYYNTVANDTRRTIEAYQLLLASYPGDYAANVNLAIIHMEEGRFDEAVRHLDVAVQGDPDNPLPWLNLGQAYMGLGRFDEARGAFESSLKVQDSTNARIGLYTVAVAFGDETLAATQVDAVRGRRDEWNMVAAQAQRAHYRGRFGEAAALIDEFDRRTAGEAVRQFLGQGFIGFAINFALGGDAPRARAEVARVERAGLMTPEASDELVVLAAIMGDEALAQKHLPAAREAIRTQAASTVDQVELGEVLTGAAHFAAGRYEQAAAALARAPSLGLRNPQIKFFQGRALLALGRHAEAAASLGALARESHRLGMSSAAAAVHIDHARALAASGDAAGARAAYERAFAIWKDADADLPLLVAARQEHAKLTS
ncbi:MAG: protein kinase [Acidobacteriota bacterium]